MISGRRIDWENLIEKRIGKVIGKGKRSDESLEIYDLADHFQKYKRYYKQVSHIIIKLCIEYYRKRLF